MNNQEGALRNLDALGKRIFIIPAEVKGFFRARRTLVHAFLFIIFVTLPWLKVNGNPVLLLNIPERRFSFFGFLFLAHDGPLLLFIFSFLVFGLIFATAVWGRVWCGWACPQTVFIDFVYRRIERWIEGDYIRRRRLRDAELNFEKFWKLSLKWFLFFIVSSIFAHSFIAYFAGAHELLKMIQGSPQENWNYFLWVTCVTILFMFDFGWFREQFCIIMCPYGRFQSVLMDSDSLAVYYDSKRGEPRKGAVISSSAQTGLVQQRGDCVSCNRCVEVCPTGIDIRNGIQMECIACTACIDACNDIMKKVRKPENLIRYSALSGKARRAWRPRTLIYFLFIILSCAGFAYNLVWRDDFSAIIIRSKDVPYTLLETVDGPRVLNHFRIHLHNQTFNPHVYKVRLPQELVDKGLQMKLPQDSTEILGGSEKMLHFFVLFPNKLLEGLGTLKVDMEVFNEEKKQVKTSMTLVGP